jgi:3-oxoisoapionate kinase
MHAGTLSCVNPSTSSGEWPTRSSDLRNPTIDLLLTYYGDDFTGSTDVLEALYSGGIESVLFVRPPCAEMLKRYPKIRAFGIAGNSRTMTPAEMERMLPDVFCQLRSYEPRFVHYKVCSTFDSSPEIGSIGRAIDIGQQVFQNRFVPLVVGAPSLGRYCVFGNLFAKSGLGTEPFRLDRHPAMQRHPITPMNEADLRVHLSRQTARHIELIDALALNKEHDAVLNQLGRAPSTGSIVILDTLTDEQLRAIGALICDLQRDEEKPQFVAGSSGMDYALIKHWQMSGIAQQTSRSQHLKQGDAFSVDRMVVLSGSCSPVTDRQIRWALEHGFAELPIDVGRLLQPQQLDAYVCELAAEASSLLGSGRSVIVHTYRGSSDIPFASQKTATVRYPTDETTLGAVLAKILLSVLKDQPVRRIAVVGGDTAGQVARALEIDAVEMVAPLEPGAPLCVVRSRNSTIDGLEVTFKGGQVGHDDFFGRLLDGRSMHSPTGAAR